MKTNALRRLKIATSGKFFQSVVVLASGTGLAQVIGILALPVLTRLYTPEEFGVFGVFLAMFFVLSGISALRYEIAIPLPKKDGEAANILAVALGFVLLTSLLVLTVIFFFGPELSEFVNAPKLEPYLWLLPVALFANGIYATFQYWMTRTKNFRQIARTRLEQSVIGVFLQVFLGWLGAGVPGLLFGYIAKIGAGSFGLSRRTLADSYSAMKKINPVAMRSAMKNYDRYPKFSTFDTLANSAAVQLPVIFISFLSGNEEIGFLVLAMRVLQAPMTLLGSSIGQVYYSQAVDEHRRGNLGDLTGKVLKNLAKIGVGPIIFAGIIAPSIFGFVFGEHWVRAGILMSWLTPWVVFQFLSSPISMSMHVTGKQKTLLALTFFGLFSRFLGIFLGVSIFDITVASESYALSGPVFYGALLGFCIFYTGMTKSQIYLVLTSALPIILAWVVAGVAFRYMIVNWL